MTEPFADLSNSFAEWARPYTADDGDMMAFAKQLLDEYHCDHWSRQWEYPWVAKYLRPCPGQWILDAGGGDSPLQVVLGHHVGCKVVNADATPAHAARALKEWGAEKFANVYQVVADIGKLPYPDQTFDHVACVSTLEHTDDPHPVVDELWRVLKPGGRLVLTLDVCPHPLAEKQEALTVDEAEDLLRRFGLALPMGMKNPGILQYGYRRASLIWVLCLYGEKRFR